MMSRMPVLFVGHGSPMYAIENNQYSAKWEELGKILPKPKAILSVSAHWFTVGTRVNNTASPRMIHDMYGFPEELYRVRYTPPGSPEFAARAKKITDAQTDNSWGLDHGSWSVLRRIYPQADVPVFQLSVNSAASAQEHFDMGRKLRELREQGVLIFGSGNVVHNLAHVNWNMDGGYPWAEKFDGYIKENITNRSFDNVIRFQRAGSSSEMAFSMMDHFSPLLYVLGAADYEDQITVFNDSCVLGSISMTGYLFA